MDRIYFDHNANTPVDPRVRAAMLPFLGERYGNPSTTHWFGRRTRAAVEQARVQVADLLGCQPAQIIFTSGGTEANSTAILGAARSSGGKKHIISSRVEHSSVLGPLGFLAAQGFEIELLSVDRRGGLDLENLRKRLRPETLLVSLIGANNETGVLWPVAEIGAILSGRGVLFHCDGVQMAGKEPLDVDAMAVDYLTISSHKLNGPMGAGAIYIRRGAPMVPLIAGGDQERKLRAGTENVPGIVGFGQAAELARTGVDDYRRQVSRLRDRLEQGITAGISGVLVNGAELPRLPNTLSVSFKDVSAEAVIQELDERGFAVSAHSACDTGDLDPSHVLVAMGVPEAYLHGTLRISLGHESTEAEVDAFLAALPDPVARSREVLA